MILLFFSSVYCIAPIPPNGRKWTGRIKWKDGRRIRILSEWTVGGGLLVLVQRLEPHLAIDVREALS